MSRLQSSVKGATVETLHEANKTLALAQQGMDSVKLKYPKGYLDWNNVAVITVTDASFSNEAGFKSQQGRMHFLADAKEVKDPKSCVYKVLPLSFGSTAIRRVCRTTLQAETYSLQNGVETGHKLRGCLCELKGHIQNMKEWSSQAMESMPHLSFTDCRSLADHLSLEAPGKVIDRRLGIELMSLHEDLWQDGKLTWSTMVNGGDHLEWISTATMVSDCLTKSMRPDFLVRVLDTNLYRAEKISTKGRKK